MRGNLPVIMASALALSACDVVEVCPDIDDCIKPAPAPRPHYRLKLDVIDVEGNLSGTHIFSRTLEEQGPWCDPPPESGGDALFVGKPSPVEFGVLDGRGYLDDPACQAYEQRVIMNMTQWNTLGVDVDLGDPWLYSFQLYCGPDWDCEEVGSETVGGDAPEGLNFTWTIDFDAQAWK